MEFKRLRLSGFKSFVEPAELRIEPGLTGVVGPNGCGKSNLFEALRWVMGEGSPKSLRGAGMEDVIFAGTVRRPARDIADVTLTLGNSDRVGPVGVADEETIEVGRRIERGAGSAYRVNGRDVRQRDVQLLFADAATGAHSPALVSQGRIAGRCSRRRRVSPGCMSGGRKPSCGCALPTPIWRGSTISCTACRRRRVGCAAPPRPPSAIGR